MKKKLIIGILAMMVFGFFAVGMAAVDECLRQEVKLYADDLMKEFMSHVKKMGYDFPKENFAISTLEKEGAIEITIISDKYNFPKEDPLATGELDKILYTRRTIFNDSLVPLMKENSQDTIATVISPKEKQKEAPLEIAAEEKNEELKKKVIRLEQEVDRLKESLPPKTENKQEGQDPPRRRLQKFRPI